MKKGLINLGIMIASVGILAGCNESKKEEPSVTYQELNSALTSRNYTLKGENEFVKYIEYYDKTNNALLVENHFEERVDKDYTFLNEGKVVSVVYCNYTEAEGTYTMNANGEFKFSNAYELTDITMDEVLKGYYNIENLFKDDNGKIASAGVINVPKGSSDSKTAEAKDIKVEKDCVKFNLNVIEIQDATDHAYDRNNIYVSEICAMGKTTVEITASIKADAARIAE